MTPQELEAFEKRKKTRDARKARKKEELSKGLTSTEETESDDEEEDNESPLETITEKEEILEGVDTKILENPIDIVEQLHELPLEKLEEKKEEITEKIKTMPKELSHMAKKWKAYIEYNKLDLHQFLVKYPRHKFKEFIEEIIESEKNK